MTGLADVQSAPMLGSDGKPITTKKLVRHRVARASTASTLYVGIERANRILKFDFRHGGITRARRRDRRAAGRAQAAVQQGARKALVFVPKGMPLAGTLIALSERGLDAAGNLIGFLIGGARPGQFAIRRTDEFDISDAALLPSGDLLMLERKFSLLGGVGIRIRTIPLRAIAPGAVVDGPSIFDADLGYEIDNMEGLDVHRHGRRRHRADADLRRQFLDAAAHAAAAVHAGGVSVFLLPAGAGGAKRRMRGSLRVLMPRQTLIRRASRAASPRGREGALRLRSDPTHTHELPPRPARRRPRARRSPRARYRRA